MDNKGEIRISLGKAISLVVILIIVIATIVFCMIYKNKTDKYNENITNINEINPEPNIGSEEEPEEEQEREFEQELDKEVEKADFSIKFLKLENNKENMIYSPLSIKYALTMLSEGASGNTKIQIENVIKELNLTKYNNVDKVLSLANGIYIRDTYSKYVKEDYIKILNENYNAEINYDSFSNANNINNWIENKTLGIIKNMLRDDLVKNPNTKMLLINALAIDMEWEEPFKSSKTYGEEFNLDNGNKMIATMMHKETSNDSVSYYKDENITTLTMNLKEYNNTQLEFVAIMPEDNLSDYIEKFTIEDFDNIIKKSTLASKTKNGVKISIPKFSFDYDLKLKNNLTKMGITDAFDGDLADFSNMSESNEPIYVSDALHKANIDFTEKGVKAAAVTVIYMTMGVAVQEDKPIEISIDKPFLYVIRDKNTDEIWFVGTVYEPNLWEEDKVNYEYR